MRRFNAGKLALACALCTMAIAARAVSPQTSAFSYQGRLDAAGVAANGTYQFSFALFDAASGGNAVGTPSQQAIQVIGGVFTTDLDFGPDSFTGQQRWLEISVGTTVANEQALALRQPIDAVPVAQYALTSPTKHLLFASDTTTNSPAITVGQYSYSAACKVTGSGTNVSVTTMLSLLPLAGQTFNLYGIERMQTKDSGAFTDTAHNFHAQTSPFAFTYVQVASPLVRHYVTDTLVDDAGVLQILNLRITLNSAAGVPQNESRCMIEATIAPTS